MTTTLNFLDQIIARCVTEDAQVEILRRDRTRRIKFMFAETLAQIFSVPGLAAMVIVDAQMFDNEHGYEMVTHLNYPVQINGTRRHTSVVVVFKGACNAQACEANTGMDRDCRNAVTLDEIAVRRGEGDPGIVQKCSYLLFEDEMHNANLFQMYGYSRVNSDYPYMSLTSERFALDALSAPLLELLGRQLYRSAYNK